MKRLLQITLLLAGLAWCVPAQATGAYVGLVAIDTASSVSSLTTGSYSPTSTGNVLVAITGVGSSTVTISSVVDVGNSNHAFVQGMGCKDATATTSANTMDVWIEQVQSTGSTTFKATFSGAVTFDSLDVIEISGIDTTTPLDFCTIVTLVTTGTTLTSAAFTPTAGDENIFAVQFPGGGEGTVTAGTNYTIRSVSPVNVQRAAETRDNAPGSSQTAAINWTVTGKTAKGVVISLKAAAASTFRTQIGATLVGF